MITARLGGSLGRGGPKVLAEEVSLWGQHSPCGTSCGGRVGPPPQRPSGQRGPRPRFRSLDVPPSQPPASSPGPASPPWGAQPEGSATQEMTLVLRNAGLAATTRGGRAVAEAAWEAPSPRCRLGLPLAPNPMEVCAGGKQPDSPHSQAPTPLRKYHCQMLCCFHRTRGQCEVTGKRLTPPHPQWSHTVWAAGWAPFQGALRGPEPRPPTERPQAAGPTLPTHLPHDSPGAPGTACWLPGRVPDPL